MRENVEFVENAGDAEAERIRAYREHERLKREVQSRGADLRDTANEAIEAALATIPGLGAATSTKSLPTPSDTESKSILHVSTSPVNAKYTATVFGTVSCQIDGRRVRSVRGPLRVTVADLSTHPLRKREERYGNPDGGEDDAGYTVDTVRLREVVERAMRDLNE